MDKSIENSPDPFKGVLIPPIDEHHLRENGIGEETNIRTCIPYSQNFCFSCMCMQATVIHSKPDKGRWPQVLCNTPLQYPVKLDEHACMATIMS